VKVSQFPQFFQIMKTPAIPWVLALLVSATAHAQNPDRDRRPPPPPPFFAALDADRNGALSDDEIDGAPEVLRKLDKDGDGKITLEEFRMPPPRPPGDQEKPKNPRPPKGPVPPVIAALDADRDGTISAEEMQDASESLNKLDKNDDGEISPEELHPHGPPPREGERRRGGQGAAE
jgi:hypothetical protein